MMNAVMPAEWAPQESVWFSWPCNPATWPGRLPEIESVFAGLLALVSRYQRVDLLCVAQRQDEALRKLRAADAILERIQLHDIPTNDVWCRDHGPTFVLDRKDGSLGIIDWRYNAWGGKYPPWDDDDAVPARIGELLSCPVRRVDLVCEGGALESNGEGLLLTTTSVLCNLNRNPDHTKSQIEGILRETLGVTEVFWLDRGMETDDTDGHIDTLARFWKPDGVVACRAKSGHPDHRVLEEIWERLHDLRTPSGGHFDLVPLPHPNPVRTTSARVDRLPATYANFLLLNDAVVVPGYGQERSDREARGLLGELFPKREVHGFDSCGILHEGGSFHCLSQQQPAISK